MNQRLTELYRSCRTREALESQDQFGSANVLIGSEIERFVGLLVQECADLVDRAISEGGVDGRSLKEHFGVE